MATGGITGTTKTADGGLVYICPEDIELTYQMLREMKDE
jgi:hypothetical protein